jgi:FAD dependent oxidoreductase
MEYRRMTRRPPTVTYRTDLALLAECDVLVVGGGSAGCTAAVAAARQGSRVVLVEKYGFPGGTAVMVLDTFYGFFTPGSVEKKVVGGVPDEVVDGLKSRGVLLKRPNTYGAGAGLTYDPETLKRVWDELLCNAGVTLFLHTRFVDVLMDGVRPFGIVVATPRGPRAVRCRCLVDTTGDAEVAARAGAPFEDAGALGIAQSLTTTFKMINVDVQRATAFPKQSMWDLMRDHSDQYQLPRKEGSAHITPHAGVMVTNMTRVSGVDATDVEALSRAEREGRLQAFEYARFLRDKVPGYEHAILGGLSTQIGVRETRRIRGEYWLTKEDVLAARKFTDAIARCGAPIEEHHAGESTRWEYLPDGEHVDIPYRALLPLKIEGMLVAGRCLSASHDAHASVRSIGQCLAMGQAAGVAAALAAESRIDPRSIDPTELRHRLTQMGAIL